MSEQNADEPQGFDPTALRTIVGRPTRLDDEARSALRTLNRYGRRSGRLSPMRYHLTISHAHRFVWFRVAKVGTRTMLGHFARTGVELDVAHAMRIRYPVESFGDYFKFAFVRHPLDRFVSAWHGKVVAFNYFGFEPDVWQRMQQLEAFAEWAAGRDVEDIGLDQHLVLQSRVIDLTQIDHLGRLESFAEDFAVVCRRLDLPDLAEHERLNQSTYPGNLEVSDEVRERIAELYRLDFQVFGYRST